MAYVLSRHKVEDYARWKQVFDEFIDMRRKNGELSHQIFHIEGDPNNIEALFRWNTLENARKFLNSKELQTAMQKGGVAEPPEVTFLDCIENC